MSTDPRAVDTALLEAALALRARRDEMILSGLRAHCRTTKVELVGCVDHEHVSDAFAVRARVRGELKDFLVSGWRGAVEALAPREITEVVWATWPPQWRAR